MNSNTTRGIEQYVLKVEVLTMVKYVSLDTYFVRQAVLPYTNVQNNPLINENYGLEAICRTPEFRQAILCASESLYHSMNAYLEGTIKDSRKKRQVELSLSQYWMRMSTRATPFGLFSYVRLATFYSVSESKKSLRALIDADYEWAWSLSKKLEKVGFQELSFVANGLITNARNSFKLPYTPGTSCNVPVEVKKTDIVSYLIDKCSLGQCAYSELLQEAHGLFPNVKTFEFDEAINNLLEKEFLISELRPNLTSPHLLKALINQLESKSKFSIVAKQLEAIVNQMDFIANNVFDINTEYQLTNLICSMRALNDTPRVIKSNLICDGFATVLRPDDMKQLADFANFFIEAVAWTQNRFTLHDEYKDAFLNKYGDFRLVQLSRMLDETKGIGVPQDFKESKKKRKGEKKYPTEIPTHFLRYTHAKYREALQNAGTIDLCDLIENIGPRLEKGIPPESFELIFRLATDQSGKQVFVCNKDYGYIGVGRSIGRFSNDWDAAITSICELNNSAHRDNECIDCDLVYLPQRVHLGNVATSPSIQSYQLEYYQYSSKHSIPISDIYVGIKNDRFYLYSKHLKKRIRINTSNLLYYYGDSPEIRFLKEIQLDGVIRWNTGFIDKLNNYDYVPEVRYKSVIIRPESWIVRPPSSKFNFEEFDKWFLSKYEHLKGKELAISFADNELKINVENKNSRYLIYRHCLHSGSILLVNAYNCLSVAHATEVVVPFVLEDVSNDQNNTSIESMQEDICDCDHESFLKVGENWLSFELYGCYDPDEYISKELSCLIEELCKKGIITSFYFLRYADPRYHIRLRLFKKDILQNIALIIERLNNHVVSQFIESFNICPYDGEIERYGGPTGLQIAETIFCIDSRCAIYLMQEYSDEDREIYYVFSALDYMQMWEWDLSTQLEWLSTNTLKGEFSQEWRNLRSIYFKCYLEKKSYLPDGLYSNRMRAVTSYRNSNNFSQEVQGRILSALLHMSFNRLFGMDRMKEQRLLMFTKRLLFEIAARIESDKHEENVE